LTPATEQAAASLIQQYHSGISAAGTKPALKHFFCVRAKSQLMKDLSDKL